MDKPWKVIFAFIAVFAAGAVVGGMFGARRLAKRFRSEPAPALLAATTTTAQPAVTTTPAVVVPEKMAVAAPVKEVNRPPLPMIPGAQLRQWVLRFNLTPEQAKAVRPIVLKANEDYARLRVETTRVTEGMYADISAIMTDEQRADLEESKKKIVERMELERKRRNEQQQAEAAARKAGNKPQSE